MSYIYYSQPFAVYCMHDTVTHAHTDFLHAQLLSSFLPHFEMKKLVFDNRVMLYIMLCMLVVQHYLVLTYILLLHACLQACD